MLLIHMAELILHSQKLYACYSRILKNLPYTVTLSLKIKFYRGLVLLVSVK